MTRWRAVVVYRGAAGPVDVVHELAELAELHGLVERGPHWDTVVEIRVARINHVEDPALTLEEAASR